MQQSTDRTQVSLRLTIAFVAFFAVLAVLLRVAPRYLDLGGGVWNLMPVGALALFAGSRLRTRWAYLVPLGAMLVSDLLLIRPLASLGVFTFTWGTPLIYASFAVYVLIGRLIGQRELSPMVIGGAALVASVQFFLVTNFTVWPNNPLYPQTLGGLLSCYAAGVPFYRHTLASDLFFSALFFGLHAALAWGLAPGKARQPA